MGMHVEIRYGTEGGKCEASEWIPYSVELTDEEAVVYKAAIERRINPNYLNQLEAALERARAEIEKTEIQNAIDLGDEEVMEMQGLIEVDPDEINELVSDRDEHTLAFFGLTGKSDEELDAWDANTQEMPLVRDFEEDFEPENPFDNSWELNIEYIDPNEESELGEDEARETLREMFEEADGDYSEITEYIMDHEDVFCPEEEHDYMTLEDLAVEIAEDMGIEDFEMDWETEDYEE